MTRFAARAAWFACATAAVVGVAACSSSGGSSSAGGGNTSVGGGSTPAAGGGTPASTATSSSGGNGGGDTITVNGIAFPKPEKTSITMGIASVDVAVMPTYMLYDEGIAAKFGITIKPVFFSGDAPGEQELVAGQIDVHEGTGGAPITLDNTNKPSTMVYVGGDTVDDVLFTGKDITSAADLKGKSIAVSSTGSYSYAEAVLALKSLGLTTSDVTLQSVGSDSDRLAALKAGSVAGSIQDLTELKDLTSQGFHPLVKLGNTKTAGYVGDGTTVPNDFAQKYPNTTLALVAMEQMGQAEFHLTNSLSQNAQIWAKVSGEPLSEATSDIQEELKLPWHPKTGKCNDATMNFMKSIVATVNPAISSVDATQACTDKYINELAKMGFTKTLHIPNG